MDLVHPSPHEVRRDFYQRHGWDLVPGIAHELKDYKGRLHELELEQQQHEKYEEAPVPQSPTPGCTRDP